MPKSVAERSRAYRLRKQKYAREVGLCYSCYKEKPHAGYSICATCNAVTAQRIQRKRKRDRDAAKFQHVVAAHERAGDVACEHHFYAAAAQHYQDALEVHGLDDLTRTRISEKVAEVLWFGNEPGAAVPLNDHLLDIYRVRSGQDTEIVSVLFRITRHLWADSQTEKKLPILKQALHIAERSGNQALLKKATIFIASTLSQLGRHEEARNHLRSIGEVDAADSLAIRVAYWVEKGVIAANFGNEDEALADLNRAVDATKHDLDPYRPTSTLANYAFVALMFGRTKLAKACRERALLAVRRGNIAWFIPKCCLEYAELLMRMGQHDAAYPYLLEALSSDAKTPILDEIVAYVGIPLALHMKDEGTLAKCMRPQVIDRAFASGEPSRIGFVTAAFAHLYSERGESLKAQALLHRAVRMMCSVDNVWHLPLEVARNGAVADIPRARRLLEARAEFPQAQVAEAYLQLFDAFIAQREQRIDDAHACARDAAVRFDTFQWGMYADLARSLLPRRMQRRLAVQIHNTKPFSDPHVALTSREGEIATFILKGLTNHQIADTISITENTVEKHVASVMSKLGIRSRYQLADVLTYPEVKKTF